jgi:ADP-heptose:LPS heptosyltransferase
VLGFDADTISRLYLPLTADAVEAKALRERYLHRRSLPLIGISWWSSHYGKDLPSLAHWRRLIEELPAQFVSLQYGDVAADLAALRGGEPARLVADDSVDQLADMDRFASQIAALDLVVTISNSGAHLAGALGQRMILVRDDLFRRNWPYLSRKVPWYPGAIVIGKDDRPWDVAFDEVIATAKQLTGL